MDQSIRIESKQDEKGNNVISVRDAETDEICLNISSIVIKLARDDVVVADIHYDDGAVSRRYVGDIAVTVLTDVLPVQEGQDNDNSTAI